jgi:isoquinoline 1-oxidoreductase subunit beta
MLQFARTYAIENVSRRNLLKGLAAGSGLVLMARLLPATARAAQSSQFYDSGSDSMPHGTVNDPHVFISIAPDGTVTIFASRSEMGTGAPRTSLPMIVAEELNADWARVKVVQSVADESIYGNQDTDGSRSVRHWLQPMRECGAAMRMMLEAAAARQWGVDVSQVRARDHEVVDTTSGNTLGYGELAAAAAGMPTPPLDQLTFKDPSQYRYIGKGNVSIVDLFDITVGKAQYGADFRLPGQRYAVISRPPVVGGKLVSYDASDAMKVPGVERVTVVQGWQPPGTKFLPLGGVAVIARNTGAAIKGRDALKIVWDDGPNKSYDSDTYRAQLQAAVNAPGEVVRNGGDFDQAAKSAARVISAEYYTPTLAHVSMEAPTALVSVSGDKVEAWAPVQSSGGTRDDLAKLLNVPVKNVTLHVTLLGGGFGRKSKCDYVLEAGLLSKEIGAPVQVQWTREDDIQHCFFHAEEAQRIDAALDANNKVIGWRHRSAAPSILSTFKTGVDHQANFEAQMGLVDLAFDIPNIRCETGAAVAHARIGWFRSVRFIPRAFAIQTFVAELAHELGRDQKDMLLELLGPPRIEDPRPQMAPGIYSVQAYFNAPYESFPIDAGRIRRVVELVAEKAGWGRKLPPGHGMGIAVHPQDRANTCVATVVEVAVASDGSFSVPRVDTAIDCGFHVNPERIMSQCEGAAIMGMSLAKYGKITFKDGRVQQSNFFDYPLIRINEAPKVTNVYIVPQPYEVHASGVGEPPLPPFTPALCNAILAATGKRIRTLPIGTHISTT